MTRTNSSLRANSQIDDLREISAQYDAGVQLLDE